VNGVIRGGRYFDNIIRYYRCANRYIKDRTGTIGQNPAQIGFRL